MVGHMSDLVERLQASGVRLTAQRRVVAEVLEGENVHLTADQVLARAQGQLPEVGRATVYKALAEFVAAGSVREVQVGDGPKRFDPNAHVEHHHAHCRVCGELWDQPVAAFATSLVAPVSLPSFVVEATEVTFLGLCTSCIEDERSPTA